MHTNTHRNHRFHLPGAVFLLLLSCLLASAQDNPQRRRRPRIAFETDTPMVHDPVMAYENGTYYLLSTGMGVQLMTSPDRRTWTVQPRGALNELPSWTRDSVPGFRGHVWAPDLLRYRDRWWLAYSCSTFGRNTSAIGLASSPTLDYRDSLHYAWTDHGALICSREGRDNWNAIDPALVLDEKGLPWLAWGSFWDGIQLVPLDAETMHVAAGAHPVTIARRQAPRDTLSAQPNPTSRHAGRNAIEAPFIFHHGDYFYLFVSHDYCCRGAQSDYKVAVGRSRHVSGPYTDRQGREMTAGGGELFLQGDHVEFEATGHCALYHFGEQDIFICHGYSTRHGGQAILVQRAVSWTADGWPFINETNK